MCPRSLRNQLGSRSRCTFKRTALCSTRTAGQRDLTWGPDASALMGQHGNQGSKASDILYLKALAAP